MLQLNLLSPEAKAALAYERYRRAVLWFGGGLAVALLIFLVLLLPTYFFLIFQRGEVLRALELEMRSEEFLKSREVESFIREVNALARAIRVEEASRITLSPLLAEVIRALPPAVTISSLQFEERRRELALTGHADTRAAFLQTLANLRANPRFESLSSPITNIIRDRDIDFTLKATLK